MAELTTAKRKKLKSSQFALPGKGEGPEGKGAGSYPIPDEAHARAALSRAAQHASPAEQATIKRKVKAKFPKIEVGSGKLTMLGQKTLGRLQSKYGDAEGKKRFHGQIKAGHLDGKRMLVNGD
jgi:hypothetical protein